MAAIQNNEADKIGLKRFYKSVGIASSLISALLILAGISSLSLVLKLDFINNWLKIFDDNWIILFSKLNFGAVQRDSLSALHLIDFAIMILFCLISIAFCYNLWKKNIIWAIFSIFAVISPFLGIVLLYLTHSGGRTGILTAGLIFSILMLLSNRFGKFTSIIGTLSFFILLICCDLFSGIALSKITGIFINIGYIFWILWFFLISKKYFQLGKG